MYFGTPMTIQSKYFPDELRADLYVFVKFESVEAKQFKVHNFDLFAPPWTWHDYKHMLN